MAGHHKWHTLMTLRDILRGEKAQERREELRREIEEVDKLSREQADKSPG